MKKMTHILLVLLLFCAVLPSGCAGESQNPYTGTLSEELYATEEEARDGFAKEELEHACHIELRGYEKERDLTKEEIAALPLGEHKGVERAEKGKVSFHTTGMENMYLFFREEYPDELQSSLYLLKYADGYRFFAPPPEVGERLTVSYWKFVFFENEDYRNCTIESVITREQGIKVKQTGLLKVNDEALYCESHSIDTADGHKEDRGTKTYDWALKMGYGECRYEIFRSNFTNTESLASARINSVDIEGLKAYRAVPQYNNIMSVMSSIWLNSHLECSPTAFFKTENGFSYDIGAYIGSLYGMQSEGKFSVKMNGDRIEKVMMEYKGDGISGKGVMTVKKFGSTKVKIPSEVKEAVQ